MPGHIHSIIQNESDSCEYENILFNLDMLGVPPTKGIAVVTQIIGSLLLKSGIVYFVKDSPCDCIYFHFPLPLPFAIFAAPIHGTVIQLVLQLFLRSDAVNLSVL